MRLCKKKHVKDIFLQCKILSSTLISDFFQETTMSDAETCKSCKSILRKNHIIFINVLKKSISAMNCIKFIDYIRQR